MKWQVSILMFFVLFLFAACAAPAAAPQAEGEQPVQLDEADGSDSEASQQHAEATEAESATQSVVTVYKSPTCGCCNGWVEHMEEAGYVIEAHDVNDVMAIKQEHQVPGGLQSCHTAIVDGYVIEGHVPAEDISELLTQRPDVAGLAVPGMPVGSPGMEMPGNAGQPFDVVTFDVDGNVEVFASHNQ